MCGTPVSYTMALRKVQIYLNFINSLVGYNANTYKHKVLVLRPSRVTENVGINKKLYCQ